MTLRHLDAAFLSHEGRVFTSLDQRVEHELKRIFFLKIDHVKKVEDLSSQYKLFIVNIASTESDAAVFKFVSQIRDAICQHPDPATARTPVLFITRVPQESLRAWAEAQYADNWYCDLISCDHLFELALRASNLLRICDHLREMKVYEDEVQKLKVQVTEVEKKLERHLGRGA